MLEQIKNPCHDYSSFIYCPMQNSEANTFLSCLISQGVNGIQKKPTSDSKGKTLKNHCKVFKLRVLVILTQYLIGANHPAHYLTSKVKRAQKHNQKVITARQINILHKNFQSLPPLSKSTNIMCIMHSCVLFAHN